MVDLELIKNQVNSKMNVNKKIKKGNAKMLLNVFNKYLKEKFGVRESMSLANQRIVKEIKKMCDENDIDYAKFIEDVVMNWSYYQSKFFKAKSLPIPQLKFIAGNFTALVVISKEKMDGNTKKGLKSVFLEGED